jgi:hypothetical protein
MSNIAAKSLDRLAAFPKARMTRIVFRSSVPDISHPEKTGKYEAGAAWALLPTTIQPPLARRHLRTSTTDDA